MTYKFSLSDIAIAAFALILVSTFSLQLHINRSLSSKVLAQSVYHVMCGNTIMPDDTVVVCQQGQTTTRGSDVYRCNSTCTDWIFVPPDNPVTDRGACCTDDGIQSTCNDAYPSSTVCTKGNAAFPAGVKWFDSRNGCYSARAQNGGKCVPAAASSISSSLSPSPPTASSASSSFAIIFDQAVCGDSKTDKPNGYGVFEECDWGSRNSDTLPDACRKNCTNPRCGDGVIDSSNNEECDDGDLGNGPNGWNTCDVNCKAITAGAAAPSLTDFVYFMVPGGYMGLDLSYLFENAAGSASSAGTSTSLFDWNALFFPISPLAW